MVEKLQKLILREQTIEQFGHDPLQLSNGSTKYVLHSCVICSMPKRNTFRHFIQGNALSHLKCKNQLRQKTCLKKYGVEHPSQLKQVKQKKEQVSLQKYGVDNPLKSKQIKRKIQQTLLKKYGVDHSLKNKEIFEKRKQTYLERYQVDHPLKNKEIFEKRKRTNIEKYGIEYLGNLKHSLQGREYWLEQIFWDDCKINPNQDLPEKWSQGTPQKFEIICSCGNLFSPEFKNFTSGLHKSCGHFNQSQGERELGELLERLFPNQVIAQDNLGFLKRQRVDYAVRDLKLVFEYDGEQHYKPIEKFGGEKGFKQAQQRDKRKNELLKKHDWILIRIRYDQDIKSQLYNALGMLDFFEISKQKYKECLGIK